MKRDHLIEAVKQQMPEKRWIHTLGVMETSVALAEQYGADTDKADLAALLHDYCKYWPIEKQKEWLIKENLPALLLDYDKQLWHGPVAAEVVQQEFSIKDEDVINAIRYHTSGRTNMSLLEKIVCLADYIEPGRDFPGVDEIRELSKQSIEKALIAGFDSTICFLISKGKAIFPLTMETRNALIFETKNSKEE
ncbi:bis(5'-nucleosyl)-tetraphosphatase (symmetrical) YqeK [Chengkuizengella axinellae]|uniref:bis(5'-nucleosyl)-tetraphosphatase (symmetrical) n=1 Tax=Chengkuizengella axinellae TaxID=3064388 RepID=A0ABT9IUM8_9BACL|nr:bis(5'-nucleosyl)-tetraphosphatase (symmetrical) YqeK [Chengkuizengella sp. 2205SS18-9]MDP5273033.1 bis(5'-nucleosyl)-tetraphosphatase (symmetrical) YqeK [Chengkuizengella sp. 2205SS18-9]